MNKNIESIEKLSKELNLDVKYLVYNSEDEDSSAEYYDNYDDALEAANELAEQIAIDNPERKNEFSDNSLRTEARAVISAVIVCVDDVDPNNFAK